MFELILLGPVEARSNGTGVPLAPLERNLLALLALVPGRVVSTERIIDGLWASRPPAAPRSRVQGLVSSLRRKLGNALVTKNPGYVLDLPDGSSDLERCEDFVRRARQANNAEERAALLRAAIGLWHGEPLDGVWAPGIDVDRVRLAELRIGLLEECFDAELELGKHAELVRELVAAVSAHPLRERLTGQLMLALYRSSRQADALRAYQTLRSRLVEELGGEPCSDLRELHATILRGEATGPGTAACAPVNIASPGTSLASQPRRAEGNMAVTEQRPAQMPASVGHFVGRDADIATLTGWLPSSTEEPRVLVVSGAGGLGKSALAVRWAHTVADRFPDGQIFVDLRGSASNGALTPAAALGAVLLALGVPAEQLPITTEERAAQYRTNIHRRRVLLVADDAGSVHQLLPLVPPTSGSLLLATSRQRLTALTFHHAVRRLTLQPLAPTAARHLLRDIVGSQRIASADVSQAVDDIIRLCGGWPLAIRLAGATLAARSGQPLASFADELRERIDVLSLPDDPRTVRAAFVQSRAALEPAAARMFAQLGLLPGTSVSLYLAAAAAGVSVLRARRLLDELISANLVIETGEDRYWFHDMIARYARSCGVDLADRSVVEERVTRWYLAVFHAVAQQLNPDRQWSTVASVPDWLPSDGADLSQLLWSDRANLPAVISWIAAHGSPRLTWDILSRAQASGVDLPVAIREVGLAAAQCLDDRHARGEAHARLGTALLLEGAALERASRHLSAAVELLGSDDDQLTGIASFGLGALRARQRRPAEAQAVLERALRLMDPGREPLSYAVALASCSQVLSRWGGRQMSERFAQAVILAEATIGERYRPCHGSAGESVEDFLAHVERSLDTARISTADRQMARNLIDISVVLRARDTMLATPTIRRTRGNAVGDRVFRLSRLDAATSH